LVLPYTSSIILVETLEEILSDKIRALYERQYNKGRDIYDVWWLTKKLGISPQWPITQNKFEMYQAPFVAAREADFFQKKEHVSNITAAIESDLTRFIPQNIYSLHRERGLKQRYVDDYGMSLTSLPVRELGLKLFCFSEPQKRCATS